jgi:pilus assembly protein CpaC
MAPGLGGYERAEARTSFFSLSDATHAGRLRVVVNKSQTIEVDTPFAEVLVGNADIADVLPVSDQAIYVLGKEVGATNISIYDENRVLIGVLDLEISFDVVNLTSVLHENVPGGDVRVSSVNGQLMLSGTVLDAPAMERAMTLARQFSPSGVTNAMSIGTAQQVLLEVRFIEAQRSAGRDLGIKWDVVNQYFSAQTGVGVLTNATPFGTIIGSLLSGGIDADIIIEALEERGLARRLAEPNLVAMSGESASFLAGGEFPFPTGANENEIRIEFKKFGVGLEFTPTVLSDSLINLEISPEVSQLDPTTTLRIAGVEIPSLIVRRASTTVELRDGQSFAIAGLLQANHTNATAALPWIGQVPVLGPLFRSSSFAKEETDLVIIITPHLVQPATPDQRLATPLDNSLPGNDVDFFFDGNMEVPHDVIDLFESGDTLQGPFGHIIPTASTGHSSSSFFGTAPATLEGVNYNVR